MWTPHPPLEAYRRDLTRLGDPPAIGPDDAGWLATTTLLARYVEAAPAERVGLAPHLAAHLATHGGVSVLAAGLHFAIALEDAGALNLAAAWLSALERLGADDRPLELGRVIARRARIAHKLGLADAALELYRVVAQLGEAHAEPELTTQAWNGIALVAHVRGNHPEARRWYRAAALVADDTGCVEQACIAHQGLLILAGVARDFEHALAEGRLAMAAAEYDREQLAVVLNNVAQVLHDMGQHAAALRGFGAVVHRTRVPRTLLAALGGAALAAAALDQPAIVDAAAERIARLSHAEWPYPHAVAQLDLSDAYALLGDIKRSAASRFRAHEMATVHGYHELVYRAEHSPPQHAMRAARTALGPAAAGIISAFESLDAPLDLVAAADGVGEVQ